MRNPFGPMRVSAESPLNEIDGGFLQSMKPDEHIYLRNR
jgi:hypothetical protein